MKRSTIVVAIAAVLATLVAATAALAGGSNGKTLYRYVGELTGKEGTSVTVKVQNGNRAALRSLLSKGQEQKFATGDKTVFLKWTNGIPQKVGIGDLAVGDRVAVNVRADRQAPFETIAGTPAAIVGDHGTNWSKPDKPLYLFRGTFVSADAGTGRVTIDVKGGNHRALRLMIGQDDTQSFLTNLDTVFLHWAKRIPDVINASQLKVGDRIIVRVRADQGSTLTQVETTPAKRVAAREPKSQEANQSAQA